MTENERNLRTKIRDLDAMIEKGEEVDGFTYNQLLELEHQLDIELSKQGGGKLDR